METNEMLGLILSEVKKISEKMDNLETKVEKLEEGQIKLEKRMDNIEKRMDNLEEGQIKLEKRMDNIEKRMDNLETKVDSLEEGQMKLEKRMDNLETRMERNFKETQEQIVNAVNVLGEENKSDKSIMGTALYDIAWLKSKIR